MAQLETLNLPGRGLWQAIGELDPTRVLERSQAILDEGLQFFSQVVTGARVCDDDDECLGLDQTLLIEGADHRGFENLVMCDQRRFDLEGRHPLTADLQHVIGAAAVDIVTLAVAQIFVTGARPGTVEGVEALSPLIPITNRGGLAVDLKLSHLTVDNFSALLVDDAQLIARDGRAAGAIVHVVDPVTQKYVQ